jgi:anaerobic ribonucleoside-triphosphate reductase activating protein
MPDYIEGLTLLGGEPFEPENQAVLVGLLRKVKKIYPRKSIWCYTGYTYERDLLSGGDKHTSHTDEMLSMIDILVDGRFLMVEKDITLLYRGSRNQRILDLHPSGTDGTGRKYFAKDVLGEIRDIAKGDSNWK